MTSSESDGAKKSQEGLKNCSTGVHCNCVNNLLQFFEMIKICFLISNFVCEMCAFHIIYRHNIKGPKDWRKN